MQEISMTDSHQLNFFSRPFNFFKHLMKEYEEKKILKGLETAFIFDQAEKAQELLQKYIAHHTSEEVSRLFNTRPNKHSTLLQLSVRSKLYTCSLLLLEHGASPNQYYHHGKWYTYFPLANNLISGNMSTAQLLCLFGARVDDTPISSQLSEKNQQRRKKIKEYIRSQLQPLGNLRMAQMRIALEAESRGDTQAASAAYRQVAKIWYDAWQGETLAELKQLYYQRYQDFTEKAAELGRSHDIPAPTTRAMQYRGKHTVQDESQQPLLADQHAMAGLKSK